MYPLTIMDLLEPFDAGSKGLKQNISWDVPQRYLLSLVMATERRVGSLYMADGGCWKRNIDLCGLWGVLRSNMGLEMMNGMEKQTLWMYYDLSLFSLYYLIK